MDFLPGELHPLAHTGVTTMLMIQFDARGRFVRKLRFNAAVYSLWLSQLPNSTISFEVIR